MSMDTLNRLTLAARAHDAAPSPATQQEYLAAIRALAEEHNIDLSVDPLAPPSGVPLDAAMPGSAPNVPFETHIEGRMADAREDHRAALAEHQRRINEAVTTGAALVTGVGLTIAGGGAPAPAILAALPALFSLIRGDSKPAGDVVT